MNLYFFDRTAGEWIVPGIFLGAVLVELSFLLVFYLRLLFLKKSSENVTEMPVAICLCVRNEEERIGQVLQQLLELDYANFEVVVVDDFSEDCTLQKIGQLAEKYPRLKFTTISQETRFSEKLSINLALKASKSALAVFIRPESEQLDLNYLKKMNNYSDGSNLLINYSNFSSERNFYNKLCRIERYLSFLSSAAYSMAGLPVFYQENNILFPKAIYFDSMGFKGKMNDHFANLELVFNKMAKKEIKVSIDEETFVREDTKIEKKDFSELIRKKIHLKQRLGAGKRLLLFVEDLSKLVFLASLLTIVAIEPQIWLFVVLSTMPVFMLHFIIVKKMTVRLKEDKIFISSFVYSFVRPFINLYYASKIFIHDKRN
jgi:glycosyltransferase involved in cell wall biosynthesis